MKNQTVRSIKWIPGEFTFKKPFKVSDKVLTSRPYWTLELETDAGELLRSELSPLEGLHKNSPESIYQKAKELVSKWIGKDIIKEISDLPAAMPAEDQSSINFCLEGLKVPPHSAGNIDSKVGLWVPGNEHPSFSGLSRLKIKVGRLPEDKELSEVKNFLEIIPSNVLLRIDGNRNLDKVYLEKLCSILPLEKVEFFEEPLSSIEQWYNSSLKSLPLAIDESLEEFLKNDSLEASCLVLKPQWVGGISSTEKLIKLAQTKKIKVCLSSCFEGPLGLSKIQELERLHPDTCLPSGLGTLSFFKNS